MFINDLNQQSSNYLRRFCVRVQNVVHVRFLLTGFNTFKQLEVRTCISSYKNVSALPELILKAHERDVKYLKLSTHATQ